MLIIASASVRCRLIFHFQIENIVESYRRYILINFLTSYYDQSSFFCKVSLQALRFWPRSPAG